jgi:hypothetical protein
VIEPQTIGGDDQQQRRARLLLAAETGGLRRAERPVARCPHGRNGGAGQGRDETLADRPEQARRGPGLGRSHLGDSGRRESGVVSWPVPWIRAGPAALLLATSRAGAVVEARPAFVVAHDTVRELVLTRARGGQRTLSWTQTGEVRVQELAGAGQSSVAFVEHRGEPLEHVRDARCDFEPDGDVGRGGAGGEPGGIVEEDLV